MRYVKPVVAALAFVIVCIALVLALAACGPVTTNCPGWMADCQKLDRLCVDADKTPGACQESEFCWRNYQFDCQGKPKL